MGNSCQILPLIATSTTVTATAKTQISISTQMCSAKANVVDDLPTTMPPLLSPSTRGWRSQSPSNENENESESESQTQSGFESFRFFARLPVELRCQIWRLAIEDSNRVVYLRQHKTLASSTTTLDVKPWRGVGNILHRFSFTSRPSSMVPPEASLQAAAFSYSSACPPPVLLSVCCESRMVAQAYYTRCFGSTSHPPMTYMCFDRDALYLSYTFLRDAAIEPSGSFRTDLKNDIQKIKHLFISGVWQPFSQVPWQAEWGMCLIKVLAAFGGLESVTLVDGRHEVNEPVLLVWNARCPYLCWCSHLDDQVEASESGCLRNSDPDWEHLQRYGDCMYVQRPEGLSTWPTFFFRTVVSSEFITKSLSVPKMIKGRKSLWSKMLGA